MAKKSPLSQANDEMKQFSKESTSLVVVLQDLAKALKSNAKEAAKFTGESVEAFTEGTKEALDLAKTLQGFSRENLKSKKQQSALEDKIEKSFTNQTKIANKIAFLEEKRLTSSKQEIVFINKALKGLQATEETLNESVKNAQKLKNTFDGLSNSNPFEGLSEVVGSIPVINKILPEFSKASKTFRDNMVDSGNKMESLGKGGKELVGAFGKMALALVVASAVDQIIKLDERTVQFSRTLGISETEAFNLQDQILKSANNSGKLYFNAERFNEALSNVNSTLGTNATISSDMAENYSALVYRLGLSNDEATKFNLTSITLGKNSKTYTGYLTAQVKLLNGENKLQISNQQIMKDISNTSSRIQLSTKATGKDLISAVYASKALGLNMAQLEKTADSLLNFESSISSELEAELLTGRDLNLEEARRYALNNDMAGLAREMTKQGINSANFGNMNRIQQEAIAKAFGMQADELADSLKLQDQLKSVAKDSGYRDAKSLDDLKTKVMLRSKLKDATGKEIGFAKALSEIGNDELQAQLEAATTSERAAETQLKIADKILEAVGPKGLQNSIDILHNSIYVLAAAVGVLAATQGASMIAKLRGGPAGGSSIPLRTDGKPFTPQNTTFQKNMSRAGRNPSFMSKFKGRPNGTASLGLGVAGMALNYGGDQLKESGHEDLGKATSVLGYTAQGASLGSFLPGYGTAIGAGLGAGFGIYKNYFSNENEVNTLEPGMAKGGIVPPGYPNDTYRARLSSGEAVVSVDKLYASLDKQTEYLSIISRKSNDLVVDGDRLRNNIGMGFAIG